MTKRFISATYDNQSWLRLYLCENEYESYRPSELLDLLNGLVEENEQLKQSNQRLKGALNHDWIKEAKWFRENFVRVCDELAEENKLYAKLNDEYEELKKENEWLKQQINKLENDSTNSRNDKEKSCGYCKNYNLDGMFGIWCSIHETPTYGKFCQDFEWNR